MEALFEEVATRVIDGSWRRSAGQLLGRLREPPARWLWRSMGQEGVLRGA